MINDDWIMEMVRMWSSTMYFMSCLPTFSLSMYSVHLIPSLYIADPTSTLYND